MFPRNSSFNSSLDSKYTVLVPLAKVILLLVNFCCSNLFVTFEIFDACCRLPVILV